MLSATGAPRKGAGSALGAITWRDKEDLDSLEPLSHPHKEIAQHQASDVLSLSVWPVRRHRRSAARSAGAGGEVRSECR